MKEPVKWKRKPRKYLWHEIAIRTKKKHNRILRDIDGIVKLFKPRRFFFFFEEEYGITYVLRLETRLSYNDFNEKVKKMDLGRDKFRVFPYSKEERAFKPLTEEVLDFFHVVSDIVVKIGSVKRKDRGTRLNTEDLVHLLVNPILGNIADEGNFYSCIAMNRKVLTYLIQKGKIELPVWRGWNE